LYKFLTGGGLDHNSTGKWKEVNVGVGNEASGMPLNLSRFRHCVVLFIWKQGRVIVSMGYLLLNWLPKLSCDGPVIRFGFVFVG
jgi:hypothetical protein